MTDKQRRILAKVQQLAAQGFYGERDAAQETLRRLCAKYGITDDGSNVFEPLRTEHAFRYTTGYDRRLLAQIIYKVTNSKRIYNKRHVSNGKRTKFVYTMCSAEDAYMIEFLHELYARQWQTELEAFFAAYIQKHEIYGASDDPTDPLSTAEWLKMRQYMASMDDVAIRLQLEAKT